MIPILAQVDIKYEKYELPNGLDVILHEDHSVPIVGVNVWYHVGSAREKPGRTGIAHLFEHMMFQGSQNVGHNEHFRLIQGVGGNANGSTAEDRTNYWEVVPANYLEMVLWLEADRMGFLLPAMTQQKLDNQRDVVKNERRQSYENQPYGLAWETMCAALYPPENPYHWPVIGSMADLSAASLDDVHEFFKKYYPPNNASLCIGGDFNPKEAKQWVEKYFGEVPQGPSPGPISAGQPVVKEPRRLLLEDRVQLPRLYLAWHSPPLYEEGDAEMDILAGILSRGKSSRLYRRLVYEKKIAQDVFTCQQSRELSSLFFIIATAKPGIMLTELEKEIWSELECLEQEGPGENEVQRAKNSLKADFIYELQSIGGFGGKTDRLNEYNVLLGNPGYFNQELARYEKVRGRGVQGMANSYLSSDRVVILSIVPEGKKELEARP
ncbi:MAG: pitrilysin family protein [Bacteroidota bacterium]